MYGLPEYDWRELQRRREEEEKYRKWYDPNDPTNYYNDPAQWWDDPERMNDPRNAELVKKWRAGDNTTSK